MNRHESSDAGTAGAGAVRIRRALISVSDKSGLTALGRALADLQVEILSTGGTAKALAKAGVVTREVSDYTGFPEMMDGRVKTLHPKVHGGLLGLRDNAEHRRAMEAHAIAPIDLVVVNLYPFEDTVAAGAESQACIEQIDIGGPAMIRSAAKNYAFVTVVVDPADYAVLIADLTSLDGTVGLDLRRRLAAKAFARTASYDAGIANWFAGREGETLPERLTLTGARREILRYGENPHQSAAFYAAPGATRVGIASADQLQGKALSYNNLGDTEAAFELVSEFSPERGAAVAIIKHANPCGVAVAERPLDAYRKARACDPLSAFGGIVALNRRLDEETAQAITELFTEVVIAPEIEAAARTVLAAKKNLRVLETGALADPAAPGLVLRSVAGGFLVQTRDNGRIDRGDLNVVTRRRPSARELEDLIFAFRVAKHVKSNAIVYVRDHATVGIGAGQMSRVDAAMIAARKAEDAARAAGLDAPLTQGSVVASDAFFPFADGLLAASKAGATAVIQPGGSIRDDEVIAAADDSGLAMVFTGMRHFRH